MTEKQIRLAHCSPGNHASSSSRWVWCHLNGKAIRSFSGKATPMISLLFWFVVFSYTQISRLAVFVTATTLGRNPKSISKANLLKKITFNKAECRNPKYDKKKTADRKTNHRFKIFHRTRKVNRLWYWKMETTLWTYNRGKITSHSWN